MHTKLFLTSILAIGFAMPAMADDFPTNGLMQEDTIYDNAATENNMDGVYEGTVNAEAQYEDKTYTVTAGNYLPMNSETLTPCPAGSFCDGSAGTVNYSTTTDQGIETCPTGYTSSAEGATSNEQCYRACNGNVEIAHATGVTGNDYYGNGTDTCAVTECEHGWHVRDAVDLMTIIGTASRSGNGYASTNINGSSLSSYGLTVAAAGISGDPMAFAVDYGSKGNKGMIKGHGICSMRVMTEPWDYDTENYILQSDSVVSDLDDDTGQDGAQYCYCHLDSYTAKGSNTAVALSGPWIALTDYGSSNDCQNNCSNYCGYTMYSDYGSLSFRATIFSLIEPSPASCEVNTITINWTGASQAAINANNAGTATYGGDIRTPQSAEHVPGKTFTGWRFSKPSQQ